MRSVGLLVLFLLSMMYTASAQQIKNIDEIGNVNEGLIAIKKNASWGFIDINGTLIIDFRKDIVASFGESPRFSNGLCLIKEKRDDIFYYGYINTKGETIIPTEYIVATPFEKGMARVIKHYKTTQIGTNALGKDIVRYSYNEMIIDAENNELSHITGPHNLMFYKLKLEKYLPSIKSQFISDHIVAIRENDNSYSILKIK